MRHLINGSLYDHNKLYFYAIIKTRSINHGTTNISKTLNLVNEVSLSLHGFVLFRYICLVANNAFVLTNIIFQESK